MVCGCVCGCVFKEDSVEEVELELGLEKCAQFGWV